MELTWLADTPQSRRRSRALRACSDCQRRKVRAGMTFLNTRDIRLTLKEETLPPSPRSMCVEK